ncbi:19571_t:CDS:1, partial [Cetraspora pellucida]
FPDSRFDLSEFDEESNNINDTGNVEWENALVGRKGLPVTMIENPSDKCNINVGEQDTLNNVNG